MAEQTLPLVIGSDYSEVEGGNIWYPKVLAGASVYIMERINARIIEEVYALKVKQNPGTGAISEATGFFEIKTNERGILSLVLSNYTYFEHSAHGMTYLKALTFNTKTGEEYPLKKLFKPNSDYVRKLSAIINTQIKQRELSLLGEFKGISPDQDFYIADKSLVPFFQLYEITPYYVGFPMFPISVFSISNIFLDDGPLGRMATNL